MSECVELNTSLCALYTSQEYEEELEMLQEQKTTYEAKIEEYEAMQLQKKVLSLSLIDFSVVY